ncbi:MAG: type I-C CRISPR-associated protein Cas8c/Csd1 [Magnetococcus sp. WYHC-3]
MSILQALYRYQQRLDSQGLVSPKGYSLEKISHAIVLNLHGEVVAVDTLENDKGHARELSVPASFKRTGTVSKPFFLWDKTNYLLGVAKSVPNDPEKTEDVVMRAAGSLFPEFRRLHQERLAGVTSPGLRALVVFLNRWDPTHFVPPLFDDAHRGKNFVFRLDGQREFLHETDEARDLVEQGAPDGDQQGRITCLVTGLQNQPLARIHDSIKGVENAQSSGANIVSFNKSKLAFVSYGKEQGANAPISLRAATAYTKALNHLLKKSDHNRQRLLLGDATMVFWAEAAAAEQAQAAEEMFATLATPPEDVEESAKLADLLKHMSLGKPLQDINPRLDPASQFFVLGISPNVSRLSIRFWYQSTLEVIGQRFVQHFNDLRLIPTPGHEHPSLCRLINETALKTKHDKPWKPYANVSPLLAGEVMRAILEGQRYPRSLLASTVVRLRADRDVSGLRAAICKACLTRDYRLSIEKEDVPVSLDREECNPGYLMGRLFSVLERTQQAALGTVNASIRDRYYGAASATPSSIFPILLRNLGHHLSKMRKSGKGGLAHWMEAEAGEIMNKVGTSLPRHLGLEDQGRFAIGYYHQGHTRKETADDKE